MIIALLIALGLSGFSYPHTSAFDREIACWHKKATMQCVMLSDNQVDDQQILKNLNELETELKVVTDKYLNKPPAKYAKDVNWKSYFQTLSENIIVVKELVEKKQFAQASIYCTIFSRTFEQMHKINGTSDLTDEVFSWRMELKNTSDMLIVGNNEGATLNREQLETIYKQVEVKKTHRKDKSLNEVFKPLEDAYKEWIIAEKAGNKEQINTSLKAFMDAFPKPYMASFYKKNRLDRLLNKPEFK